MPLDAQGPTLTVLVESASERELQQLAQWAARLDGRSSVQTFVCAPSTPHAPRTVQGLAAGLVARLREVQPHGPYRLIGWRLAGLVAYEMACQLIGSDEQVS